MDRFVRAAGLEWSNVKEVEEYYDRQVIFELHEMVDHILIDLDFWREHFGTDVIFADSIPDENTIIIGIAIGYYPSEYAGGPINMYSVEDEIVTFLPYEPTQNTVAVYDSLYGKRQVPIASIENASRQLGFDLFPFVSEGRFGGNIEMPYYASPVQRLYREWQPEPINLMTISPLFDVPVRDAYFDRHGQSGIVVVEIDKAHIYDDISFDLDGLFKQMKCTALWIEYMNDDLYIMPAQGTENVPILTTGHMPSDMPYGIYLQDVPYESDLISIYTPTEVRHFTANELLSLEKETEIPILDATQQGRFADYYNTMPHNIYCVDWSLIQPGQLVQSRYGDDLTSMISF